MFRTSNIVAWVPSVLGSATANLPGVTATNCVAESQTDCLTARLQTHSRKFEVQKPLSHPHILASVSYLSLVTRVDVQNQATCKQICTHNVGFFKYKIKLKIVASNISTQIDIQLPWKPQASNQILLQIRLVQVAEAGLWKLLIIFSRHAPR